MLDNILSLNLYFIKKNKLCSKIKNYIKIMLAEKNKKNTTKNQKTRIRLKIIMALKEKKILQICYNWKVIYRRQIKIEKNKYKKT